MPPGLSAKSRSNCIGLHHDLLPLFSSHVHVPIGNAVVLRLGEYAIAIVNLHFPYHDNVLMPFDEALELLEKLLDDVAKAAKINLGVKHANLITFVGGDLNSDVRCSSNSGRHEKHLDRASRICASFKRHGISFYNPVLEHIITHQHWKDECIVSLSDWFLGTDKYMQINTHYLSNNLFCVSEDLICFKKSDHRPINMHFDLGNIVRYQDLKRHNKLGYYNKRFSGPSVPFHWKPSPAAKATFQSSIIIKSQTQN